MKRALLRIVAVSLALMLVYAFASYIPDAPHVEHQKHHAIRASVAHRHAGAPVAVMLTGTEVRTRPCDAGISSESTPFSTGTSRRLQLLDVLRV
jgi:hypothetical protein